MFTDMNNRKSNSPEEISHQTQGDFQEAVRPEFEAAMQEAKRRAMLPETREQQEARMRNLYSDPASPIDKQ